jgi:ABC-type bacteriocin/lantibiotic exporter with double-glycine peptidase domain
MRISVPEMPHISAIFSSFLERKKSEVALYTAIICVAALERVAVPHIYGKLLQGIRTMNKVGVLFAVLVAIFATFQVLETWLTFLDANLVPEFESHVREHVLNEVIARHRLQYAELDLGNFTSKLIKLPAYMRDVFYRTKAFLLYHVLAVLTTGAYLLYCHWALGGVFVAVFAVLAFGASRFLENCKSMSYRREEAFDNTQESIQDILFNLLSVYNTHNEVSEHANVQHMNAVLMRRVRASVYCGIPYRVFFSVCFLILFTAVTGGGIYLYKSGRIGQDLLVSSFIVTFAMLRTCMSIYHDFESFIFLRGGMQVVEDFLDQLPKQQVCTDPFIIVELPVHESHPKGVDIVFDNVGFRYRGVGNGDSGGGGDQPAALDGFTARIRAGERVAVRGGVGSGKSTLSHVLVRLQCHQRGEIRVNGVDVRRLDVGQLRRAVQYVGQHPRLFNRTLWENLSYGNPRMPDEERLYALLRRLRLDDVVRAFRPIMHRPVGKQGGKLSGGQRQIAWLLRALLTPSKALILDEPTSAMDEQTRTQVMRLITNLAGGRTLILITHDPQLLPMASRVLTLRAGAVVSDKQTTARRAPPPQQAVSSCGSC